VSQVDAAATRFWHSDACLALVATIAIHVLLLMLVLPMTGHGSRGAPGSTGMSNALTVDFVAIARTAEAPRAELAAESMKPAEALPAELDSPQQDRSPDAAQDHATSQSEALSPSTGTLEGSSGTALGSSQAEGDYLAVLKQAILAHWPATMDAAAAKRCKITIQQMPGGQVRSSVGSCIAGAEAARLWKLPLLWLSHCLIWDTRPTSGRKSS